MPCVIINTDRLEVAGTVSSLSIALQIQQVYFKDEKTLVLNTQEGTSFSKLDKDELRSLLLKLGIPATAVDDADYPTQISYLKYWCENSPIVDPNQEALDYIQGIIRGQNVAAPALSESKPKKEPRAPADPSATPSPKGSTGKVWEIAEAKLIEQNVPPMTLQSLLVSKDFRKIVIQACIEAGINEATAGTQWSKWKKTKAIS